MKINTFIREAVKFATSGSVQMMLGGVVAAVIPPQVKLPYKIATFIGSAMVALYAGEKMDEFVDNKLNEVEETVDTIQAMVAETKNEEE